MNEYGSDQSDVSVEVYEPAKFVRVPKDVVITSLETVDLDCAVILDPRLERETEVRWLDGEGNGIIVNEDKFSLGRENALVIKSTMKGDQASTTCYMYIKRNRPNSCSYLNSMTRQGSYTCVVHNEYQTSNKTTRLTVLGEPPSFIATEKDVRVLEGDDVTISCQANAIPIPEIVWFRQDSTYNIIYFQPKCEHKTSVKELLRRSQIKSPLSHHTGTAKKSF